MPCWPLARCSRWGPRRWRSPTPPADDDGPPPDTGVVGSADPGVVTTPGRLDPHRRRDQRDRVSRRPPDHRGVLARVPRGWHVHRDGDRQGQDLAGGGALEAGYQIGCGIELGQVRLIGQAGVQVNFGSGAALEGRGFPLSGTIEIHPKPGTVSTVTVDKKSFKAAPVRVTLKDTHIKVDGCVGQSFLRSYATLTSSTTDTDDVVAYYGITKSV